jgi:AraC-like DNA-binding protein
MLDRRFEPLPLTKPGRALAARVPYWFQRIGVALTMVDPRGWHALHAHANTLDFETEYGVEPERWTYNGRLANEVAERRRLLVGEHAGFCDLFVPLLEGDQVRQLLIAGPFLTERPSAARLVEQWNGLTKRYAHPSDPGFARYAAITLDTLVLTSKNLELFERYMEKIAALFCGAEPDPALIAELEEATNTLAEARHADRMWSAVETMLHPSTARLWASPARAEQRAELGLGRPLSTAMVGLFAARSGQGDPVEEMLQRDACQRAFVEFCMKRGGMLSGKLGDYGASILMPNERSSTRMRSRFVEVANMLRGLARELGLSLHLGTSGRRAESLPDAYSAAFAAANHALSCGMSLVEESDPATDATDSLFDLRRELAQVDALQPFELGARFERYLRAAAARCGQRAELFRFTLAVGLERLTEPFVLRGILEAGRHREILSGAERATETTLGTAELISHYRRTVAGVELELSAPKAARRAVNLERSLAYIQAHLGEPLRLPDVARAGGFSADHFSRLFKQRERVPFEKYVEHLRVERARQLLLRSNVAVTSVATLCGFASASYFHRVFKRVVKLTPAGYRASHRMKALRASRSRRALNPRVGRRR